MTIGTVYAIEQLVCRSCCGTVSDDEKGALLCTPKLAHRFGRGRGLPTRLYISLVLRTP